MRTTGRWSGKIKRRLKFLNNVPKDSFCHYLGEGGGAVRGFKVATDGMQSTAADLNFLMPEAETTELGRQYQVLTVLWKNFNINY